MPKKEGNPIQVLLIITMVLVVILIGITLFLPQKTNGEKVGYFLPDETNPSPSAIPPASGSSTTPSPTA